MDDMIVVPYTLNRVLLAPFGAQHIVKAVDATVMDTLYTDLDTFLTTEIDDYTVRNTLTNAIRS
jgi:hypothetical protein